jgi:Ca-activated chloride channel homolog
LAPLGASLRAAAAAAFSVLRWLAGGLLAGLRAVGLALVRLVIVPLAGVGLKVLRATFGQLFLAFRAFSDWLVQPLIAHGVRVPVARLGLLSAGAALLLAGWSVLPPVACRLGVQPMCAPAPCAAPREAVLVSFFSSNTKEDWIDTVTAAFNAAQPTTASGKPIFVCVTHGNSGGQQLQLRNGEIEPIAWSPGDKSWVDSINLLWEDRHGRPLVSSPCLPTVISPIGFAMWRSMAEALGWPDRRISWHDLVTLAADPQGWGRYGHPEWGAFKFGHTHPDQSNSGLLILTALAHDVQGQTAPLSVEQVDSRAFEAAMRGLEFHTYHYGIQSRDLIGLMIALGQDYLHAVNTTETETLRTNQRRKDELPQPLSFIFPGRGTYWTEQPYCVLDADWVTDEQREAAHLYGAYLREPAQQALAPASYLRPLDPSIPLGDLFTVANGTDPRVTTSQVPALESPAPEVAALVKDIFHRTKKKATIVILLDVSGSMQGEKMTSAIEATIAFLRHLDRDDEVYVYAFGDGVSAVEPGGPARAVEEALSGALNSLKAAGGTALYDAVCQGSQHIRQLRAEHEAAGEARLYGVVLLSDGEDTASGTTEAAMRACLAPSGPERTKVFAIQYGSVADEVVLAGIASQTLGKLFVAEASSIAEVYLAISAEQ